MLTDDPQEKPPEMQRAPGLAAGGSLHLYIGDGLVTGYL